MRDSRRKHARQSKANAAAPRESKAIAPMTVTLEKPLYGGDMLTRVDGKAVFVPMTLPGEVAKIQVVEDKKSYAKAEALEILQPSPHRIAPRCKHFGECGGCSYQHANYATQLAMKREILRETMTRAKIVLPIEIETIAAEPRGHRNRIRVAVTREGRPAYRARRTNALVEIEECPIAAPLLVEAAKVGTKTLRELSPWRSGAEAEEITLFCDAEESALLATLHAVDWNKAQTAKWAASMQSAVPQLLGAACAGADGTAASLGADLLDYVVGGAKYEVEQGAFFQVNRFIVDEMVAHVTQGRSGALAWDLYAGVGLFAKALAKRFKRVVAVESSPFAKRSLAANLLATNGIAVGADTSLFLANPALLAKDANRAPDLVVVDPPRAGLGVQAARMLAAAAPREIIYVSCDPATLARDLGELIAAGYQMGRVTLADMFPQTYHLETIVELKRA